MDDDDDLEWNSECESARDLDNTYFISWPATTEWWTKRKWTDGRQQIEWLEERKWA